MSRALDTRLNSFTVASASVLFLFQIGEITAPTESFARAFRNLIRPAGWSNEHAGNLLREGSENERADKAMRFAQYGNSREPEEGGFPKSRLQQMLLLGSMFSCGGTCAEKPPRLRPLGCLHGKSTNEDPVTHHLPPALI